MKYYVSADPHGFYSIFHQALEEKGFFSDREPNKLIICGDLMDRGKEAREMQRFILALIREDRVILVRGNHEDLFMDLIGRDHGLAMSHHVYNGTYATALMLTGMSRREALENPEELCERAASTPFVKEIIPRTVDFFEDGKYIFVHGWLPMSYHTERGTMPVLRISRGWRHVGKSMRAAARWKNGMEEAAMGTIRGKTIVCGHWHTSYGHAVLEGKGSEFGDDADFSPYVGKGIIALDACTAHSNQINVIVLET